MPTLSLGFSFSKTNFSSVFIKQFLSGSYILNLYMTKMALFILFNGQLWAIKRLKNVLLIKSGTGLIHHCQFQVHVHQVSLSKVPGLSLILLTELPVGLGDSLFQQKTVIWENQGLKTGGRKISYVLLLRSSPFLVVLTVLFCFPWNLALFLLILSNNHVKESHLKFTVTLAYFWILTPFMKHF